MEPKEEHGMKNHFQKFIRTFMIGGALTTALHPLLAESTGDSLTIPHEVDVQLQEALSQLKSTVTLESAFVGFVGSLSENLQRLQVVLKQDKAEVHLQELYQSGNLVSKMYAIIGLQLLNRNVAAQALLDDARQYQAESIQLMEGCVIYQAQVHDVRNQIAEGYFVEEFQAALR
jgi:hypothetical protein